MLSLAPISSARHSQLAFALLSLPKWRRKDALVFFQFCRTIDNIADEPSRTHEEKHRLLDEWLQAIELEFLPDQLEEVIRRNNIPRAFLVEIVRGCASDIVPVRYQSFPDLEKYCWRVACAVGLVAIRIFQCTQVQSISYAENLGHALQLTNILRDVGEDASLGRIYLPLDDLARFGVQEEALLAGCPGPGFQALMQFEATRARMRFRAAVPPVADSSLLLPAEIMKAIYMKILSRLEQKKFTVFEPQLRLGHIEKYLIAFATWFRYLKC